LVFRFAWKSSGLQHRFEARAFQHATTVSIDGHQLGANAPRSINHAEAKAAFLFDELRLIAGCDIPKLPN
jgi:hypothetical protein